MGWWIFLAAVVLLFVWAGWRQSRYGGTARYDRSGQYEGPHHRYGNHNPWGSGND